MLKFNFSDHLMVKFIVSNKTLIHLPRYRLVRNYSKINWDQVNNQLADDVRIQSASISDDVNNICDSIMTSINEKLDEQEPLRRIQISDKIPNFASTETKNEIMKRDDASERAKTTRNDDDIREWKTIRNRVHKMLKQDKETKIKNDHEKIEGDFKTSGH